MFNVSENDLKTQRIFVCKTNAVSVARIKLYYLIPKMPQRDHMLLNRTKIHLHSIGMRCLSDILSTSRTTEAQIQLSHFLEGIVLGFCLLDTE